MMYNAYHNRHIAQPYYTKPKNKPKVELLELRIHGILNLFLDFYFKNSVQLGIMMKFENIDDFRAEVLKLTLQYYNTLKKGDKVKKLFLHIFGIEYNATTTRSICNDFPSIGSAMDMSSDEYDKFSGKAFKKYSSYINEELIKEERCRITDAELFEKFPAYFTLVFNYNSEEIPEEKVAVNMSGLHQQCFIKFIKHKWRSPVHEKLYKESINDLEDLEVTIYRIDRVENYDDYLDYLKAISRAFNERQEFYTGRHYVKKSEREKVVPFPTHKTTYTPKKKAESKPRTESKPKPKSNIRKVRNIKKKGKGIRTSSGIVFCNKSTNTVSHPVRRSNFYYQHECNRNRSHNRHHNAVEVPFASIGLSFIYEEDHFNSLMYTENIRRKVEIDGYLETGLII